MPNLKSAKQAVVLSKARDLVSTGPKHVSSKHHRKNDEEAKERPTTTRALILRNGKHGARGTGELVLASKLTGREKLDLLAEDLTERAKKAVAAPFKLERCLQVAEAQCNAYLDDIAHLHDHTLFYHIMYEEVLARSNINKDKDKSSNQPGDLLKNPSHVASIVATRIHNSYMLASAWKVILYSLIELGDSGLRDVTVKSQLRDDEHLRLRFLAIHKMVKLVVDMTQAQFAVLATTTSHYQPYFKKVEGSAPDDEEVVFNWDSIELRDACKSFLDSIIIELCFPRGPYRKGVLYQILAEAVEESPREAKRFPQALWDAVGDLSVSVELQDLIEAPLVGPEAESWSTESSEMPPEYDKWVDAQIFSSAAASNYLNFKDQIFPLERTKTRSVLDTLWKYINLNYTNVSGKDINSLWNLDAALAPNPQWHAYSFSGLGDLDDGAPALSGKRRPLRLTNGGDGGESGDSMPELQSVSDSSSMDSADPFTDESDSEDESDSGDDESGYDTDQEDDLREQLREAMDIAHEADYQHSADLPPELDPFLDERKHNPFLKLLGSLRGRMFSSNPKLKTTGRGETRMPLKPTVSPSKGPTTQTKAEPTKLHKTTIEEVDDEDDNHIAAAKKKKKKKPKKKKKSTIATSVAEADEEEPAVAEQSPTVPAAADINSEKLPAATTPTKKKTVPVVVKNPVPAYAASTASLPLPETKAQSARSYLQEMPSLKSKVKSRPDHASIFSHPDKPEKRSFLSRFGLGKDKNKDEQKEIKDNKKSWFSRLSKKTVHYMHQLLRTSEDDKKGMAPMKWDDFLKVMREMGFEYDPSTAGSSVRFIPPDPRDKPITFHKPHPDPTLYPILLKEYGSKLKKHYGWNEEDLIKYTNMT